MSDRVTHGAKWIVREAGSAEELHSWLTELAAEDWIVHTITSNVLRTGKLFYTVIAWLPSEPKTEKTRGQ